MEQVIQEDPATEKPFRTLRPHNKSRLGCTSCKRRKVKCDEIQPTCGTCRLRKTKCEYSSVQNVGFRTAVVPLRMSKAIVPCSLSAENVERIDTAAYNIGDGISTLCIDPLTSYMPAPIDHVDMKVLWFYTAATCRSFSVEDRNQQPMQDTLQNAVVRCAFESPFLMNTLLALASLHMQSLGQGIGVRRSLSYSGQAFEGHRKAISKANPKTYGALLTNALLLALLASPSFRKVGEARLLLIDWMLMWRGIPSVIDITGFECLTVNGLDALFNRPVLQPNVNGDAVPKELLTMLSFTQTDDEDSSEVLTYHETLQCLASLYQHLSEHGLDAKMAMRIITWFTVVPEGFIVLARAERPRAMVILAHYAAFLKLVDSIWWLKDVGDSSIYDIWQHLQSEWHEYMQLPTWVMGVADQSDICRLLLSQVEHHFTDPTEHSISGNVTTAVEL
jgi:hypothetical protein